MQFSGIFWGENPLFWANFGLRPPCSLNSLPPGHNPGSTPETPWPEPPCGGSPLVPCNMAHEFNERPKQKKKKERERERKKERTENPAWCQEVLIKKMEIRSTKNSACFATTSLGHFRKNFLPRPKSWIRVTLLLVGLMAEWRIKCTQDKHHTSWAA